MLRISLIPFDLSERSRRLERLRSFPIDPEEIFYNSSDICKISLSKTHPRAAEAATETAITTTVTAIAIVVLVIYL